MIVSLPPFFGPLKRVIGEPTLIGACSGNLTTALPKPLPTIASVQARRAAATSVATQFALVQTGMPVVSTRAMLVEFERERVEDRRQLAGDGREFAAAVDDDRRVFVLRQRLRREAPVGVEHQVARDAICTLVVVAPGVGDHG